MLFNNKNFEVIKYGTNEHLKQHQYKVEDEPREVKHTLKDLGVWMSADGRFVPQINHHKNCSTTEWLDTPRIPDQATSTFPPSVEALVVSRLKYACQLWSPHKVKDIQDMEQVRGFPRGGWSGIP